MAATQDPQNVEEMPSFADHTNPSDDVRGTFHPQTTSLLRFPR